MDRKVYCEVIEGVVYQDRCLLKLSKMVKDNKTCETCIVREMERIQSRKRNLPRLPCMPYGGGAQGANVELSETYSTQELTQILGKAKRTLQEWALAGKIPAIRLGSKWRYPKEEINRLYPKREDTTLEPPQPEDKKEPPESQKPILSPENPGETEKGVQTVGE